MASGAATCDTVVMDIGRVGIWTFSLELQPAARAQEAASEIESLGYRALWIPEALGREAFTHAGLLLAGTRRLIVATGIANIWARDAMTMAAGEKTLDEAHPGRFLLGIGVSHAPLVEAVRGHRYEKPLSFMRRYLDAMDAAPFLAAPPSTPTRRVIGALAPKMPPWPPSAPRERIPTLCRRSTRREPRRSWDAVHCWHPSRRWCWRPTRRRHARSPACTWPLTSGCPTTSAI